MNKKIDKLNNRGIKINCKKEAYLDIETCLE